VATLEILTGAAAGQCYDVARGQTLLGRDPYCDVVLPMRSISRQHARILTEGEHFFVEDMHSLNGTYVNGQRIASRTRLRNRDQIQLYEILMAFYEGAREPKQSIEPRLSPIDLHDSPGDGPPRIRTTIVGSIDGNAESAFDLGTRARLQAILEIIRGLGQTLEVEIFLPNVLDSLFEIFPQADRGYILLADPDDGHLTPQAMKSRHGDAGSSATMGPISRSVATRVMSAGEAILSSDGSGVEGSILDSGGTSAMTVPLMGPSRKPLGILHVDSEDASRRFSREDLEVLLSVGTVVGQAVEFARMHQASLLNDRRERDLATAREVQLHFLPNARPVVPGYRFFDYYEAAEDVGGDYFGYIPLADGRLAIALGDVSGKGVPAALLMARLCSEVRYCLAISSTLVEGVERLNRELAGATLNDRFVTFLLCVLDPQQNTLEIVNAGHLPPLRLRAGVVTKLGIAEAGPPLGYDPTQHYELFSTPLEEVDTLILYTDGISEARSPADTIYGTQRVCKIVADGPADVEVLGLKILDSVERFVAGRAQCDDVCLLAFGRGKGVEGSA